MQEYMSIGDEAAEQGAMWSVFMAKIVFMWILPIILLLFGLILVQTSGYVGENKLFIFLPGIWLAFSLFLAIVRKK